MQQISGISGRSPGFWAPQEGLNKNTFYYHFEGMPDLADAAMDGIMFQEPARQALYMAYASGGIVNVLRHRSPSEYGAVLTTLGESPTMRDIVGEIMGKGATGHRACLN
jgi:AcrR family transcriptional regulator